jgi:XTP/dITP diphosphohydrolase
LRIVLATSNKGKVREIKEFLKDIEVIPYSDLIDSFHIEEHGDTFKKNAVIKAKAVYEALKSKGFSEIVIADDSGISVEVLGWKPDIYSARYAGVNATSEDNLNKMISELKEFGVDSSKAYYTAAIAIVDRDGDVQTTHGWMHGRVIPEKRGNGGFGYDPIFIPDGENETLGTLPNSVKEGYSHRVKALKLAKLILNKLK